MENRIITVIRGQEQHLVYAGTGSNLRAVLLEAGFSPYTNLTKTLNCGGRGICATCGVWIHGTDPEPQHWHDRLAKKYGYARLSCQIQVESDMTIALDTEKKIWGSRRK